MLTVTTSSTILVTPFMGIMQRIPALANNLAVAVLKPRLPEELHPWLTVDGADIVLNTDWMKGRYGYKRRKVPT